MAAQQCLARAAALLCRLISTDAGGMRAGAMDLAALSMLDRAASSPVDGDGHSCVCALAVAMDLAAECRLESISVLRRWRLTEPGRKARWRARVLVACAGSPEMAGAVVSGVCVSCCDGRRRVR